VEGIHSWNLLMQPQCSKKKITPALYLVSDKGVLFTVIIGYTKYEWKTFCSNFNWSDCNWNISCIFAVLTSQKGEGSFLQSILAMTVRFCVC
jgi:hypothetical protein